MEGRKLQKINLEAKNLHEIEIKGCPMMKDVSERAEILARLMILHNSEDYPKKGLDDIEEEKLENSNNDNGGAVE